MNASRQRMPRKATCVAMLLAVILLTGPAGAVQFQSASTFASANNATAVTLAKPATLNANDVMLAFVSIRGGATTLTAPSGWSLVDRTDHATVDLTQAVYSRIATATESGPYTWSFSPGGWGAGAILSYAGVDVSAPIEAVASSTNIANPITAPSVTSAGPDATLVTLFSQAAGSAITTPAGMQARASDSTGGGPNGVGVAAADEAHPTAGATGTRDASGSAGSGYIAHSLLLKPPTVFFSSASSSGDESVTPANLQVSLSSPSSLATTIDYAITGGTATGSGTDFTLASGTLTILAGSTTGTIPIDVVDDAEQEADETVEVTLSNPDNARLGTTATHTYTIVDNDGPRIEIATDPVAADGTSLTGARWGGWSAQAGAAPATGTNYLKITNIGPAANQQATIDFTDTVFAGVTQTSETIGLDGKVQFAAWEDTSPATSAPNEGSYTFGSAAANGDLTVTFTGTGNIIYVTYQLVSIPDPIIDQEYTAQYTVTEV